MRNQWFDKDSNNIHQNFSQGADMHLFSLFSWFNKECTVS
jgi:hypothetical protein